MTTATSISQPRVWDASFLSVADACWRKHYLQTLRGLRKDGTPSVHLTWGKAYHACVEHYDREILAGSPPDAARDGTIALALAYGETEQWGEWITIWSCSSPQLVPAKRLKAEDGSPKFIVNRARCKMVKGQMLLDEELPARCPECGLAVEWQSVFVPYDKVKNGTTLLAAVQTYCSASTSIKPFQFDMGEAPAIPGVEIQARLPLPITHPSGEPYELLANIDSLVEWEGEIAIRERKTTGRAFDWRYWLEWENSIQILTYDLVGSVIYTDADGRPPKIMVEALRAGAEPEIERHVVHIPETRRAEWFEELQDIISESQDRVWLAQASDDPAEAFPQRRASCIKGFMICPFFAVCTAPKEEREFIIEAAYHVERWSPEAAETISEGEGNE